MLFFADKLTLDKARRTSDGYMAIHARAARGGIYQYTGREVDPEGKTFTADQVVNVYRPPEEVFDKESLASFVGKPITDDHPAEGVDATNWRDLARGTIMNATRHIAEDGDFVGFDMAFMDAKTIAKIDAGTRELSNGYGADIEFGDGVAPDGAKYQATQRNIRGNHVAVVKAGRAGSCCRLGDVAICAPIASDQVRKLLVDQRTYDDAKSSAIKPATQDANGDAKVSTKTIMVDGLQVEVTDAAEAAIKKLQGQIADGAAALEKANAEIAQLKTDKATVEAEKTKLETNLADAKAAASPEKLRDAAKELAAVADKAKALGVKVGDEMDAGAIMKAVVTAQMGDKAADYDDTQIAAAFAALTKDAKSAAPRDKLADAISQGIRPIGDSAHGIADARNAALARKEGAYLGPIAGNA